MATHGFCDTLSAEDRIHLLQAEALRLRHNKPHEDDTTQSHEPKEEEGPIPDVLDEVWRNLSYDEVAHPIRRGADRNSISPITEGPNLTDQDPCTWTPGIAEVDDEQPYHGHGGPSSSFVCSPLVVVLREDDSDCKVTKQHAYSACDHHGFAAQLINVHHCWNRGEEQKNTNHSGSQQRDRIGVLAERCEY